MTIERFTENDGTRLWEHLNRLASDVEALVASKPAVFADQVPVTVAASSSVTTVVPLPAGRFVNPVAVVSLYGRSSSLGNIVAWVASASATQVEILVSNRNATQQSISLTVLVMERGF